MSDLIYREDAIKAACKGFCHPGIFCPDTGCKNELEPLRNIPAVEQETGKWIIRDNSGTGWYRVTCSECGEDVTSTIPMIGFFTNAKPLWDYCPWCGARMENSNG